MSNVLLYEWREILQRSKSPPLILWIERCGWQRVIMAKDIQYLEKNKGSSRYVTVHPAWQSFIVFCKSMRFGEIEKLKIQDGIPVLAEEARKKIKFSESIVRKTSDLSSRTNRVKDDLKRPLLNSLLSIFT